jgi:aminoglycoside phosphotransferase (APT) family kinase protein
MPVEVDADRILRELNTRTGAGLSLLGIAAHGETGGAMYVRWPDGRDGVVTPSAERIEDLRRTAGVLALARARGLPVPVYELIVPLDDTIAVVQERLPGRVRRLDVAKIEAMIEANERFAGVLADRRDVPVERFRLHDRQWHRLLEGYSDRSRNLLARIRALGDAAELPGDDLVYLDFNGENVLFDDAGTVTGVIDWGGSARRGDRRSALIKLLFDLAWSTLFHPARTRPCWPGWTSCSTP